MSESTHTFIVRGRAVGFVPGNYGGALIVLERGYFPVSPTGYRSLAGHFGFSGRIDPTAVAPELLESLAANQDKERRAIQVRLQRAPRISSDRLGNFVSVSLGAERAFGKGFFAPDAERIRLWRGAYWLLRLIDTDLRFQPAPMAPHGHAQCAAWLAAHRKLLWCIAFVSRRLVRPPGTFVSPRSRLQGLSQQHTLAVPLQQHQHRTPAVSRAVRESLACRASTSKVFPGLREP